jgi:hypothetical protein
MRNLLLFAVCLCCAAASPRQDDDEFKPALLRDSVLTEQGLSTLKEATRVQVFRVDAKLSEDPSIERVMGYPVTSTAPEQGANFAARLAKLLVSDNMKRSLKRCGFMPGVAYRLWHEDNSVTVCVCFGCKDVIVQVGEKSVAPSKIWYFDFAPVRPRFVALAKEALPNDARIQAIADKEAADADED